MLGVPIGAEVRYHERRDCAQQHDDLFRAVEPAHMGVAGGKSTVGARVTGIHLDRKEQLRRGLIEAATEEMRGAYVVKHGGGLGAGTEPQRVSNHAIKLLNYNAATGTGDVSYTGYDGSK